MKVGDSIRIGLGGGLDDYVVEKTATIEHVGLDGALLLDDGGSLEYTGGSVDEPVELVVLGDERRGARFSATRSPNENGDLALLSATPIG